MVSKYYALRKQEEDFKEYILKKIKHIERRIRRIEKKLQL